MFVRVLVHVCIRLHVFVFLVFICMLGEILSTDSFTAYHGSKPNVDYVSGSYSTVWKGIDRESKKVWALKEMQKSAVKREVCAAASFACCFQFLCTSATCVSVRWLRHECLVHIDLNVCFSACSRLICQCIRSKMPASSGSKMSYVNACIHTYMCAHTHTYTHMYLQEEEFLREEVRISTIVGSHNNIVYMKEFVENKDKYFIILEYLTGVWPPWLVSCHVCVCVYELCACVCMSAVCVYEWCVCV
jgi:serine/threonine protein kinase